MDTSSSACAGALLFSRFAYPPSDLGHTDHDNARVLAAHVDESRDPRQLGTLARGLQGALPYLRAIADAAGIADSLDARVVEAFWIGSPLLDSASLPSPPPHHNFAVLADSPWVDMVRSSGEAEALAVVDQCRVRWGRVLSIRDSVAVVRSRPITSEGRRIVLGEPRVEMAVVRSEGDGKPARVHQGDWCALHWNWVADRISTRQLVQLRKFTRLQLDAINTHSSALLSDAQEGRPA